MEPQEIVDQAEAAYQAQDVDQIVELFDPEIVFYWNGWKKGEGVDEVRQIHEEIFTEEHEYEEFEIEKTLRAASGDTIVVEWKTTWTYADGSSQSGHGGEFWTMRDDSLLEWHAYHSLHDNNGSPRFHPWDETGDR